MSHLTTTDWGVKGSIGTGGRKKLRNKELHNLQALLSAKYSGDERWVGHQNLQF